MTPYQEGCVMESARWFRIARTAEERGNKRAAAYALRVAHRWADKSQL